MNRCLREYTLVMLYIGEGTQEERAHLASCTDCSRRYQHLGRDWQHIKQLLHSAPPPRLMDRSSSSFTHRWLPVAATVAATVLLGFASARWWPSALPIVTKTIPQEEVVSFVETTVVPALFANDTLPSDDTLVVPELFADDTLPSDETNPSIDPLTLVSDDSDEAYVQDTLDEEWPCEQDASTSVLGCD